MRCAFVHETNAQEKLTPRDVRERTSSFCQAAHAGVGRTETVQIHRSGAEKPILVIALLRIDMMMVREACGRIVGGAWGICWCHGFYRSTELCFENLILVLYFLNWLQGRLEKH